MNIVLTIITESCTAQYSVVMDNFDFFVLSFIPSQNLQQNPVARLGSSVARLGSWVAH